MAKKDTQSTAQASGSTKVRRIRAAETEQKPLKAKSKPASKPVASSHKTTSATKRRNPLKASMDYFVGAWDELKQVRWPTRKATWGMTVALLAFTAFFVVVILLLDALFKYIFQLILG